MNAGVLGYYKLMGGVASSAYILDTYSGYDFAWMPFKLTTAQTTSLIVRRASDDAELTIGFDSDDDLDTAAIGTHCGSSDGFIKTFISPNANNAVQTNTSFQAKIYDGSTTTILTDGNGNAMPQFTSASSHFYTFDTELDQPVGYGVCLTMRRTAGTGFRGLYGVKNTFNCMFFGIESTNSLLVEAPNGGKRYSAPALDTTEFYTQFQIVATFADSTLRRNSVEIGSIGNFERTRDPIVQNVGVVNNNYYEGGFGGMINFPSATETSLIAVETYVNGKLNIF